MALLVLQLMSIRDLCNIEMKNLKIDFDNGNTFK